MKKSTVILLSLLFTSCGVEFDNSTPSYMQFSSDDLSYLYFNKNTFQCSGNSVKYKDTLVYLLNDTSYIQVPVTTEIYPFDPSPLNLFNIRFISGKSSISFDTKTGVKYLNIKITKSSEEGIERIFEVGANGINNFVKQYLQKDTIALDTTFVLGKLYKDVYKFYPPVEGKTNIRFIYFAKKYGYIKIEKLDGTKIERIDNGK